MLVDWMDVGEYGRISWVVDTGGFMFEIYLRFIFCTAWKFGDLRLEV
jgi:hypothetical protein